MTSSRTQDLASGWAAADPGPFARGSETQPGRLASFSMPAPGLTMKRFLHQARGQPRVFWANGRDQQRLAGFGVAAQLLAWGPQRFADIQRQAAALFAEAHVFSAENELAAPRLFGGFSFRDDFAPDNAWSAFQPAQFVLPHFQLAQAQDESWLTINAILGTDEPLLDAREVLLEALSARYAALLAAQQQASETRNEEAALQLHYPLDAARWHEQVELAVCTIRSSALEKVVLARVCEVTSPQRLDVDRALAYLNGNYGECTRFLFEPRPYHAFYGATPELLAQVNGEQLVTMALAGSAPRGSSARADAAEQRALLDSAKDRDEHRLVVAAMLRRLAPIAEAIKLSETPQVYTLSYIHHLLTPINGRLREPAGVLPVVQALHPTPALGGTPRDLALAFISTVERVPRGWYAGPVGWLDHRLNGEFAVAIRSAVTQERRAWLYAGAGIVAGSQAEREWAETALKFEPMLRALEIDPALAQASSGGSAEKT